MTTGRSVWLVLLLVGLVAAWALRRSPAERASATDRADDSAPEPSAAPADEIEIEMASPHEVGLAPAPGHAAPTNELSEAETVRTLAGTWQSDPEAAVRLAERADERFGDSPHAVERRLYEIKALVKLGRIGKARSKAERYLALYPPGPMTNEVERLTGVHRRPAP